MLHDAARFLRQNPLAHGLLVGLWLTLALDACSSSSSTPGTGRGGTGSGGSLSTSGAGAGGKTTGGEDQAPGGDGGVGGEGGETARPPRVVSVAHEDGAWLVRLDNTQGLYFMTCSGDEPSLVEQDPPKNAASLPRFGEYYVDGEYFDVEENLGCDFLSCEPLPSQIGMSDIGYVSVGTLPAPGGEGGQGGAGGEGGARGEPLPAFESYEIDGPFVLTNRYFTDEGCKHLVTQEPQIVTP